MANLYAPGFDDQVELQTLERQRKMADLLRQQSLQPLQGDMVGGHYVAPSWTQGLAKMLQARQASQMDSGIDEKQKALAAALENRRTEEYAKVMPLLTGTPGQTTATAAPLDESGYRQEGFKTDVQQTAPVAADPRAAYAMALASKDAGLRQLGLQGMQDLPKLEAAQQEREANRAFRMQEAEAARVARTEQLAQAHQQRMEMLAAQNASRAEMMAAQQEFQREMKKLGGANSQPYFQPLQTANGVMAFNARTGRVEPVVGADNKPVLGAQSDAVLQGQIAGAKAGAQATVKQGTENAANNKRSDQLLAAADEAEKLLKSGPTNSGIGAGVDWVGNKVGVSSKSAEVASKLETLAGWMTSNVPRMEGPQSNTDVDNYRVMAAKVGDKTVPVPQRLEALQTLRGLQEKYKHLNGAGQDAPAAAPAKRIRYDAQGNPIK